MARGEGGGIGVSQREERRMWEGRLGGEVAGIKFRGEGRQNSAGTEREVSWPKVVGGLSKRRHWR